MKTQKLFILALASLLVLISFASSVTINCNIFYSSNPLSRTETITEGESIEILLDANTVLEEELTVKVGLYQDGIEIKKLMPSYTTKEEYFTLITIDSSDYLIKGNYTIRAFANSSSGSFAQDHLELTVNSLPPRPDTTNPNVTIINPESEKNYTTNQTSLTFQVIEDNLDYCEYNLNDGQGWKKYSCVNGTNTISGIQASEGTNLWQVRAVDKSNNVGGDFITFNVFLPILPKPDTTAPVITILSPTSGQTYYTDYTYKNQFRFNIIEDKALDYCEYNLNDGQGWKKYSCVNGTNTINGLDFSVGYHIWEIRAIDDSGNSGNAITGFSVEEADNADPIIEMITPKNNTVYNSLLGSFTFNLTEAHLSKYCSYQLNNESEKSFLCKEGINTVKGIFTLEGPNTLKVSATDYLSDRKTTVETLFTINLSNLTLDITPPTITLIHPTENQEFEENDTIYVEIITDENATVYYVFNGKNFTMGHINGTSFNYISSNFTLPVGNYTITIYATDKSGNTATKIVNFSVKKATTDDGGNGGGGDDDDEEKDRKRKPNEDNYLNEYPWNMTNIAICPTNEIELKAPLTWWERFILWLKRLFGLI